MFSTAKCFAKLSIAVVLAGCGASDEAAEVQRDEAVVKTSASSVASTVTTTTRVVFVCNEATAFAFLIDTEAPATVGASESFQVTLHGRDFFIFPTPFAGTLTATQNLLASSATPAASPIALPVLHFPAGQPILDIGSGTATLTAAASAGSPITLDAGNFNYTIVPDDPANNTVVNDCAAADPVPPTLAVIPIVRTPTSKDDCRHDGWQSFTDDEGAPFRNPGACITFVQHS